MSILKLISSDAFITLNKEIIKAVGLEEAIMLGELASEYDYWQKRQGLTDDGYFFSTVENVEDKTTLSDYKQRRCLKNLQELGLVSVSVRGIPAKRYIKLDEQNITNIFKSKESKNLRASSKEIQELELEKPKGNNNISNNNITNNNINIEETSSSPDKKSSSSSSKRKSRKDQLVEYVNTTSFAQETKETLFKWIFQIGLKGNVTVDQLRDMLKKIWNDCSGNELLVREAVNNSYLNNWFGFFAPKKSGDFSEKKSSNHLTLDSNKNPVQPNAQGSKPNLHPTMVF